MARANIKKGNQEDGFTLALVAVLLVVAAMIAATVFHKSKRDEFWNPKVDTQRNMEKIVDVLVSYQREFQHLPCPALPTLDITDTDHGKANCSIPLTGGVYVGAVPYKTLNLSVDISGDAWGNKYTYAATLNLTKPGDAAGEFMLSQGSIQVNDADGEVTDEAAYVLVSHGPDSKGAYRNAGTNMLVECDDLPGLDQENCDNNDTFYFGTLNKEAGADHYDDHLLWRPVDYTAQNL